MKHYAEALNTFLFKRSWGEIFIALPDEQAGQLIKAIYNYTCGEDPVIEDRTLQSVCKAITADLDGSAFRYLDKAGYFKEDKDNANK
jgi:hypothetical protein